MAEKYQDMYVTSVSTNTVVLSPMPHDPPSKAGVGIQQIIIRTTESTAESGFYGSTGTCAIIRVIQRKLQ